MTAKWSGKRTPNRIPREEVKSFITMLKEHRRFKAILPYFKGQDLYKDLLAGISFQSTPEEVRFFKKRAYDKFRDARLDAMNFPGKEARIRQIYGRIRPLVSNVDMAMVQEHRFSDNDDFMWIFTMLRHYEPTNANLASFGASSLSLETEEEIFRKISAIMNKYLGMCLNKDHAGYKKSVHDCPHEDCQVRSVLHG